MVFQLNEILIPGGQETATQPPRAAEGVRRSGFMVSVGMWNWGVLINFQAGQHIIQQVKSVVTKLIRSKKCLDFRTSRNGVRLKCVGGVVVVESCGTH